jgi:hypothetical protein
VRTALGPVFLTGLFALAGGGVLHAIRPFRRRAPLQWLAAGGLAYFVGVSVVVLLLIAAATVGATASLSLFVVTALAVAGTGFAIGVLRVQTDRVAPEPVVARVPRDRADRIMFIALGGGFAVFALAILSQYTSIPWFDYDGWAIWANKAKALFYFGGIDPTFFSAPQYSYSHQDYPLLVPMLEMLHWRAVGRLDLQSVHVQFWLMLAAFPWALGYLASRTGRPAVWMPIVFGAVTAPAIYTVIISGLADVPVAIFLTCAVLAMGLWVEGRRREDLAVAIILLAATANIKNEGLLAAAVVLAAAAIVLAFERPRRRLLELAAGIVVFLAAILPWQLWAGSHHVPKDVNLADGLNPAYLVSHLDRFMPSVHELLNQITNQDRWDYYVPLAIVAVGVALVIRRATRVAAFYAIAGVGFFLALVWAYWASPHPLAAYLAQSGFRVVDGLVGISMAALAHVCGRLAAPDVVLATAEDQPALAEAPATSAKEERPQPGRDRVPAGLLTFWRA